MVRVEIERDVLENIYKALHWYVSRECDYNRVTEDLLSDMDKVATVLYGKKNEDNCVSIIEDWLHHRCVWGNDGEFHRI